MTAYVQAAADQGVWDKTLAAATVDTVTLNRLSHLIAITTDGTSPISFTMDGTTPTVGAQAAYHVPKVAGVYTFVCPGQNTGVAIVVSLISAGTPVYSVATAYGIQNTVSG